MAFESLVTVFIKIVNSASCVGLYYGLLTCFSIRPSFFLLFVNEPEKKRAVIIGLLLGQLMRFLSIYNATLHRLLCIPHTIMAFFITYLMIFYYLDYFHPSFHLSESSTFSFFLHSFIFQLSNLPGFPTVLGTRVGHIFLFQSNNKLDFLTANFFGWAIGQVWLILFLERLFSEVATRVDKYRLSYNREGLVSEWKKSITKYRGGEEFLAFLDQRVSEFVAYRNKYSTKIYQYLEKHLRHDFTDLVRDYNWFMSEVKYFALIDIIRNPSRILTILLYIIILTLGIERVPAIGRRIGWSMPQRVTPADAGYLKMQMETAYDLIGLRNNMKRIQKEFEFKESCATLLKDSEVDRDVDLNEVKVGNGLLGPVSFDMGIETFATNFFGLNRWLRPLEYKRNELFAAAVRERTSQYFFDTCRSDGKERIAFTYLPALSYFQAMMKRGRISSSTVERPSFDELDKTWMNQNNEKKKLK